MKRILVTGGAGFIGSATTTQLLSDKDNMIACVDNFDDAYDKVFKLDNISSFAENERFTLHEVDIVDRESLDKVFSEFKPTHVLHLAAKADTRRAVSEPYVYIDTNITGTLNVFELSVLHGVDQVVAASSSSVYGNNTSVPWQESNKDLQPLSPYGVTKLSTEYLGWTYFKNHNLPITMMRYFNAYGECNRPNMVPYIWTEAMLKDQPIKISGDGSRRRDYTYIGDIARGTVKALETPLGFEILNMGQGSPLSLTELLELLTKKVGKKPEVISRPSHPASVEETYADTTKAHELLGWKPEVSHEEGIGRLVDWFVGHRLEKGS